MTEQCNAAINLMSPWYDIYDHGLVGAYVDAYCTEKEPLETGTVNSWQMFSRYPTEYRGPTFIATNDPYNRYITPGYSSEQMLQLGLMKLHKISSNVTIVYYFSPDMNLIRNRYTYPTTWAIPPTYQECAGQVFVPDLNSDIYLFGAEPGFYATRNNSEDSGFYIGTTLYHLVVPNLEAMGNQEQPLNTINSSHDNGFEKITSYDPDYVDSPEGNGHLYSGYKMHLLMTATIYTYLPTGFEPEPGHPGGGGGGGDGYTGNCDLPEMVELNPDNLDDILPPGYVH